MSRKKNKTSRKHIVLRWWQKILLIVGCTGLCVLLTWLLCEKWLAPSYVDTMRATLNIDKSAMDEMKSQRSEYVEDILDIQGSRGRLLKSPGEKAGEGDYYKDISLAMGEKEGKPAFSEYRLYDLFQSGIDSVNPDDMHQTVRICIENPDSGEVRIEDDSDLRRLVQVAGEKFVGLVFDGDVTEEQAKISYAYANTKKADAASNQPEYDQYEWVEADPGEESGHHDIWSISITFSKEAIDALPNRGSFYKKQVDMVELLESNMTDDDYQRITEEAGVEIKPADLRDKLTYSASIDELVLNVDVTTDLGQKETGKLAAAAANQAGRVIFRTMLGITDEEELRFRYNMDDLAGTFEPYQSIAVSKAGAYVQSFYSDRPQFRTDIAVTAKAHELNLAEFFEKDTQKGGKSTTFFSNLAQKWSSRDMLSEEGQEAYTGIAETGSIYSLSENEIKEAVSVADSGDPAGRSVQIRVDSEKLMALIKKGIEDYCAEREGELDKDITDEELHREAIEELNADKAVLLEEAGKLAGRMEDAVVAQADIVFFGYGKDHETFRDTDSRNGIITYTVTKDGLEALKDECYLNPASVEIDEAIRNLDSDEWYQHVLDKADTDGPVDYLRDHLTWSTESNITLTVSWSDRTTTTSIARAALMSLSGYLTENRDGYPLRLLEEEDSLVILREQARSKPPATMPTMVIVGLIALIISYAVFSQQPLFDTLVIIFFVIFTFICVFPFYYLLINTISDNTKVAGGRINFLPEGIHFKNYERVFSQSELGDAVIVTVARTIIGTALMVLTSAWAGYLVTKQKMWHRSFWYRALVITMYFNAGLIPWYTNMLMLGLTGNFLAYIIPGMVAPYNIILVKTYIESIPGSLEESAIIDGASTSKVFLRIILPLSIPILATIAIFGAVGNWNSFQDSLLLMSSKPSLYTLQHRLYIYLNTTTSIDTEQISEQMAQNLMNNGVTTKYTIAMVTIIPILLVYPIMQRYFVKGIMLGAVKG